MNKRNIIIMVTILALLVVVAIILLSCQAGKNDSGAGTALSGPSGTSDGEYRVPLTTDDMITSTPTPGSHDRTDATADSTSSSNGDDSSQMNDKPSDQTDVTGSGNVESTVAPSVTSVPTVTPSQKPSGPTKDPFEGEPFTDF